MRLEDLIGETVRDELEQFKRRYTQFPNINLMDNLSESQDSRQARKPRVKDGISFNEPIQGFSNDYYPYPWR